MRKKTLPISFIALYYIILLIIVAMFGISTNKVAFASEMDFAFYEDDFSFIPDESVNNKTYANGESGATIRLNMTQEQYTKIVAIKYTLVRIKNIDDKVTYDENEIYVNDKAITEDAEIENKTYTNSDFDIYQEPTLNAYGYVDIVAKEWCAIVLDVTYNEGDGDKITLDSYVFSVTNIDSSKPSAYYRSWSYDEGAYIFKVTVNGNQPQATATANSGIKKIEFIRKIIVGNEILVTVLDTIENITSYPYYYELKAETTQKAYFYAKVTDWVNNESNNLIVTTGSYDAGFETAVNNKINEIERVDGIFSPYILKNLADEYANYYLKVQEYEQESDEEKKEIIATKIQAQKNVIYKLLGEYADIRTLAENGVRDFNLNVINSEYLAGVAIGNVNDAYTTLLWGEVATFTITLADFDLRKIDKTTEIEASGLINASKVLNLTFTTTNSVDGEADITFTEPIEIRLPISDYKKVAAVVTRVDNQGATTIEKLQITEYKSYILVHMPYSKGVISVVFGEKAISPYYWLFTLAIIPIGIGIYFIVKKINKNKQIKLEQLGKERQEAKSLPKYVAKNKSKKGKKKRN